MKEIFPDKFGHCVVCHQNMLIEKVIDNKVVRVLKPIYEETEYLLDDGSTMNVAICRFCKNELTEKDNDYVMKCVKRGWELELEMLNDWSEAKKKDYLDRYSKKEIVANSEGMVSDIKSRKLQEYREKYVEHHKAKDI